MAVGGLLAAAGFLWQAQLTATSGYAAGILGPAVLMCLGSGLMFTPIAAAATGAVGPADAGLISGLINTARQVGGSLGLAALATLAAASVDDPVTGFRHAFLAAAILAVLVAILGPLVTRPFLDAQTTTAPDKQRGPGAQGRALPASSCPPTWQKLRRNRLGVPAQAGTDSVSRSKLRWAAMASVNLRAKAWPKGPSVLSW
jgi:MFS family permease